MVRTTAGDGHRGDDVHAGHVGDVPPVESPARLGHHDDPVEPVVGLERRPHGRRSCSCLIRPGLQSG